MTAFADDDLEDANDEAAETVALIEDADEVGQTRVLSVAGGYTLLIVLTIGFVIWRNRRKKVPAAEVEADVETDLV